MSCCSSRDSYPGNCQHQDPDTAIYLHQNQLSGTFPWHSLNGVRYLTLYENKFIGGDIEIPHNYTHSKAMNISNNSFEGMFPCLMDNDKLEFIDARFNNFDSMTIESLQDLIKQ